MFKNGIVYVNSVTAAYYKFVCSLQRCWSYLAAIRVLNLILLVVLISFSLLLLCKVCKIYMVRIISGWFMCTAPAIRRSQSSRWGLWLYCGVGTKYKFWFTSVWVKSGAKNPQTIFARGEKFSDRFPKKLLRKFCSSLKYNTNREKRGIQPKKDKWCLTQSLRDAQPIRSSDQCSPANHPQFLYWTGCPRVWNIPVASLG